MNRFIETYPVLDETPDIVLLSGGGGGESVAPEFLDQVPDRSVVIVTGTADSGSKTGRLRELVAGYDAEGNEIPLPAVGDMRRVMSAVAENREAAEIFETRLGEDATPDTVAELLQQFRGLVTPVDSPAYGDTMVSLHNVQELAHMVQEADGSLRGYVVGNLLIAQIFIDQGGDLGSAAAIANHMLSTRATVMPVSADPHHLAMRDGQNVYLTEGIIDDLEINDPQNAEVWVQPVDGIEQVGIYSPAEIAISGAKSVVLLPGSYFTTHGAMLSVPGMGEALQANQEQGGQFASVANLTTERDTRGFDLPTYVSGLGQLAGRDIDIVIVNGDTDSFPEDKVPLKYEADNDTDVPAKVIVAELLDNDTEIETDPNDPIAHLRSTVKTSGRKVAEVLVDVTVPVGVVPTIEAIAEIDGVDAKTVIADASGYYNSTLEAVETDGQPVLAIA